MKRLAVLLLLSLATTQCVWIKPRHDPGKVEPIVAKERQEGRERERAAFEDGKADGAADAARGGAKDYKAHKGRFDPATEQAYREGYNGAFDKAAASTSPLTAAQQAAHDAGYAAGLRDRRRGRGSDPDQYKGTYDAKLESWFVDGYYEGVEDRN